MDINRAIEDIETILKSMELNHKFNVILYEDDKEAFETIVRYFKENSIPKQKVKEELEKAKKENEPYEIHNKESRMFWINQGKIRLAKKLLEDK